MSSPRFVEKQERTVRQMIAEPPALSPLPQTKPQPVEDASVPTLLLGHPARSALASCSGWMVLAAFRRSLYCRADQGALICVGPPSLGPGPLNVLAALPPDLDWQKYPVPPGAHLTRRGQILALTPELRVAFGDAPVWRPVAPPAQWGVATLAAGLQALASEMDRVAPQDGLASYIPGLVTGRPPSPPGAGLARELIQAAAPAVAALQAWLTTVMSPGAVGPSPPHDVERLVGLGPGLTPSGDDLLGGTLIALHALGWPAAADVLANWLRPRARRRTHAISYAHLSCAADGQGAGVVHDTLAALCLRGTPRLREHLGALGTLGHSSGWDALAGVVLVAKVAAASRSAAPRSRTEQNSLDILNSRVRNSRRS
jgi:hypothetical protein